MISIPVFSVNSESGYYIVKRSNFQYLHTSISQQKMSQLVISALIVVDHNIDIENV